MLDPDRLCVVVWTSRLTRAERAALKRDRKAQHFTGVVFEQLTTFDPAKTELDEQVRSPDHRIRSRMRCA